VWSLSSSSSERVREKESEVGSLMRSHSGRRGRGWAAGGLIAGIAFFHFFPEPGELVRSKIGENFTVHVNDRREFLSGKANHLIKSRFISDHVHFLVINAALIQPMHGLMAPAAIGFDVESNPFFFHGIKWRKTRTFSNFHYSHLC